MKSKIWKYFQFTRNFHICHQYWIRNVAKHSHIILNILKFMNCGTQQKVLIIKIYSSIPSFLFYLQRNGFITTELYLSSFIYCHIKFHLHIFCAQVSMIALIWKDGRDLMKLICMKSYENQLKLFRLDEYEYFKFMVQKMLFLLWILIGTSWHSNLNSQFIE